MCGIFGVVKKDERINTENFNIISRLQNHRGPDDEGFWVNNDGRIALGHKRLSIIDLSQGHQPMVTNDGRTIIIYNGEIYNYIELRKELISKGHIFNTLSDTEVVVKAYLEWGEKCVNNFRGMFAFAIIDMIKREIFLARDHMGIKPLIYYVDDEIFCFASEIKTLTKISNLDLELDYVSIDLYLWLQYIPAPQTVFTKIKKFEPGHFMIVDFNGQIKTYQNYWRPVFKPNPSKSVNDWSEELADVISESVKLHTVADVSYGAFLSGGLDSSIIVKYLSALDRPQIKTFSIGFKEAEYSELKYSKIASEKFGTDHYFEIITADNYLSIFDKLVSAYGEPFGDSSAIPTYYVSKLASQHVKVVLSGDGGDELFGGYNLYQTWMNLMVKKKDRPWYLNFIRFWLSLISPHRFVPEKPNLDAWLSVISYYNFNHRRFLWKKEYQEYLNKKYKYFAQFIKDFKNNTLVNKAQLFDLANYLPFDILTKVDIASMMNSLETRVPLVDKRVIELALAMPESLNYNEEKKWEGKYLLKKNLEKEFSRAYIYREKKGFGVPLNYWFEEGGPLYNEPYIRLLNSRSKIFKEIFNLDAIYKHTTSGEHHKTYLLLFLEEWLYQYENKQARLKI